MMKVIIFSHESDLDGLYSAAIGLMRYPQAMTVFLGYGAENFSKLGNFIYSATRYSPSECGQIVHRRPWAQRRLDRNLQEDIFRCSTQGLEDNVG